MTESTTSTAALSGVRIVDASTNLAGQVATHLLAELGADVVRVVESDSGSASDLYPHGTRVWSRSKTILELSPGQQLDRGVIHSLLERADILVHDFSADEASSLGLADHELRRLYPSLVVGSAAGYPPGHPDAGRSGSELLVNARLGLLDEQEGFRDGPIFIRYPYGSWAAAYLLAGGLLVQFRQRRQGAGDGIVHTSILQGALVHAALYWQRSEPSTWADDHTLPKLDGPSFLSIFKCGDGRWLQLVGAFTKTVAMKEQLAKLGLDEMHATRVTPKSRDGWAEVFASLDSDEWLEQLWREDIACMPVLAPGEIFGFEQAQANGYTVEVDDPQFGPTVQVGHPISLDPPARIVEVDASHRGLETVISRWSASVPSPAEPHSTAASEASDSPLEGLRVLDFGVYVAGPMASQCLADFGAEVIKVEPLTGERGRSINQFAACQRGKRAMALDLRHPEAGAVRDRLLSETDLVIHNLRATAAKKLGLDPESVHKVNPNAVVVTISGYGNVGPWKDLPAFDPTALALSGAEFMLAGQGNRPAWLRNSAMDVQTGLMGFVAAMVGLVQRDRSGGGLAVNTSLLATAAMTSSETMLVDDEPLSIVEADETQAGIDWWHRIYRTADGWIAVDAPNDQSRNALLAAMSASSPDVLAGRFAELDEAAALELLEASGVASEIVAQQAADAFLDRELGREAGLADRLTETPHGVIEMPAGFWTRTDGTTLKAGSQLPDIGQHSREILTALGFDADTTEHLIAVGAVGEPAPNS